MSESNSNPKNQIDSLLALRAELINTIIQVEQVLESSGRPVQSAVITRKERRSLTQRDKRR